MTIIIIGAGITGSLTAYFLRTKFAVKCPIQILEKSRGVGGRMCSSRLEHNGEQYHVDLGAQYFSYNTDKNLSPTQKEIISLLKSHKKIVETPNTTIRNSPQQYLAKTNLFSPTGTGQISKTIQALTPNIDIHKDTLVTSNSIKDHLTNCRFLLSTIPLEQFLKNFPIYQQKVDKNILYSVRFCAGLLYETSETLKKLTGCEYIENSPIRYIKIDEIGDKNTVCIHSSVPFALNNIEKDKDEIGRELLAEFENLFKLQQSPIQAKYHKWRYSQVYKSDYKGSHFLKIEENFYLSGDAFAENGNFLGCIDTAFKTAEIISSSISK